MLYEQQVVLGPRVIRGRRPESGLSPGSRLRPALRRAILRSTASLSRALLQVPSRLVGRLTQVPDVHAGASCHLGQFPFQVVDVVGCRRGPPRSFSAISKAQPIAEVHQVHPTTAGGWLPISLHGFHHSSTGLRRRSPCTGACARPCAGGPLLCAGTTAAMLSVSAFPPHELVVVHLGKDVVVAQPLGVFIELLAPPDQHGLRSAASP